MTDQAKTTRRYVAKNTSLYNLVDRIKLWPGRSGVLHGVKTVAGAPGQLEICTHCGEQFTVWDSRNSRAARWLRNRWFIKPCPNCGVPAWKLEKYNSTIFANAKRQGRC